MFRHPAIPASICGLILPIVLAYLVAARRNRDRILLFMVFILGVAGLVLTFSRAGAIGFAVGICRLLRLAGWSGLISRRVLTVRYCWFDCGDSGQHAMRWWIYFGTRPETFSMRFNLFQAALQGYSQHPILGVGLNNSTGAMKAGKQEMRDMGIRIPLSEAAENLYLVLLTEVGPVGFILFFAFLREDRDDRAPRDERGCDRPETTAGRDRRRSCEPRDPKSCAMTRWQGHAVSATLWLFVSLIVAVARDIQAETRSYPAGANAAAHSSAICDQASRPITAERSCRWLASCWRQLSDSD